MIHTQPTQGEPMTVHISAIQTRSQIRTRKGFEETSLRELANSIKEHGILQRLIVTRADTAGEYMLVAGERRLLAASLANVDQIPVEIREGTSAELAAVQAVENLQRENLALADIAEGLAALKTQHATWQSVAKAIGKSPSWVSKHQALTKLKPIVRDAMLNGLTEDAELLCDLDKLARVNTALGAKLLQKQCAMLAQGTATRATVRASLSRAKSKGAGETSDSGAKERARAAENDDEGATNNDATRSASFELDERAARFLLSAVQLAKPGATSPLPAAMERDLALFIQTNWG